MRLISVLYFRPPGVVGEGNNGNKDPRGPVYFRHFPQLSSTREAEIRPAPRRSRRTARRNTQPARQTFARLWATTSMEAPL